jgi:hypothetical protein
VKYKVHLHQDSFKKVKKYQKALALQEQQPGAYLQALLHGEAPASLSAQEFLELLVRTKKPNIYAESAISGDGSDWTQDELSILGDVGISVPVTVFDNGRWSNPQVHPTPLPAELLFIPGALMTGRGPAAPVDQQEVTLNDELDEAAYYRLYEHRLLPLFVHANAVSARKGRQAFITIPGIGCGYFAGDFKKVLKPVLEKTLFAFLEKHHPRFPHIRAVYFDPNRGLENARHEFSQLSFMVRPLQAGNRDKPQLCPPEQYEEDGDDFSDCDLFSIVAWDHVSWPGNDFYVGSRHSDDGVKAAATSSMAALTGMEGKYDPRSFKYEPPAGYDTWEEVVLRNKIQLQVRGNLAVVDQS